MEKTSLIFGVVLLLFKIGGSFEECVTVQPAKSFWCRTIQELETNGNSQLLDVDIYDGEKLPVTSNQTHQRKPSLQVILHDDAVGGISASTYKILKDLSKQFSIDRQSKTLPKGIFDNLPIEKLHLNKNGIENIEVGAFSNMQHLQELLITNNELRRIDVGIFHSLVVETLDLSNNKISVIKRNALFNMKNLKHLNLAGNSLSEFRPDTFLSYGSKLLTLSLQSNYISEIDRNSVKGLNNLKILNLGSNSLTNIVVYTFENLVKLEELVLSSNQLRDLEADLFSVDGIPSLARLHINHNKLSYLKPQLLGRLTGLKYIRIGGNPWSCPCFDALVKWLDVRRIYQFCDFDYYSGSRPVCIVPDDHSNSCDYTPTSNQLINKFAEDNSKTPPDKDCSE